MKFYLLVIIIHLGVSSSFYAKNIDIETAKEVALNFLNITEKSALKLVMVNSTKSSNMSPRYINENALYYVFNIETNGGFIIISADDNSTPVLGFSRSGSIDTNNIPSNFRKWLEVYNKELKYIIKNNIKATKEIKNKWNKNSLKKIINNDISDYILPLLSTNWGQGVHYNSFCPDNSPTGSVATAMSQIMNYWKHPEQGNGFNSYNENDYGIISANFGSTSYVWDSLPNNLTNLNNSIAKLMFHCGVSVDMNYGIQASYSSGADLVAPAFKNYFSYSPSIQIIERNNIIENQWIELLKNELHAGRPIYYQGSGSGGANAFVCDGYNKNDYFHFNWGQGGQANGYFVVNSLNPNIISLSGGQVQGYGMHQTIIKGIEPLTDVPVFDIQLYDSLIPSESIISYNQPFSINSSIKNLGTNTFIGDYTIAIFDNSYNFVEYLDTLSDTLQAGEINNLTFSTFGTSKMLPGIYYAEVYYKPTNGNWIQVGDGNYSNSAQIKIVNPNDIELNSEMITISNNSITQSESINVNFNVVNNGSFTFNGKYRLVLLNFDGTLAQSLDTIIESNGLSSGFTYQPPFLTFNSNAVSVSPGTYFLAVQHNQNNMGWQLTGSSNYENPIYINVNEPPVFPDIYESNNTIFSSHILPNTFYNDSASIFTIGSNIHTNIDYDYYSIDLPMGYDYTIYARVHDSESTGNGQVYSNDVVWSYIIDSDNQNWSNTYDDIMLSNIDVFNGGTIKFLVSPYFQGEIGTYLLDIQIFRVSLLGINDFSVSNNIKIYPNPSRDYIIIDNIENKKIENISVTTVLGDVIKEYKVSGFPQKISTKDLSNGVYFLLLYYENKKHKLKFVKNE